jgi:hypothetical protein
VNGKPIEGALVAAIENPTMLRLRLESFPNATNSGPDGAFRIRNLASVAYSLVSEHPDLARTVMAAVPAGSKDVVVRMSPSRSPPP